MCPPKKGRSKSKGKRSCRGKRKTSQTKGWKELMNGLTWMSPFRTIPRMIKKIKNR